MLTALAFLVFFLCALVGVAMLFSDRDWAGPVAAIATVVLGAVAGTLVGWALFAPAGFQAGLVAASFLAVLGGAFAAATIEETQHGEPGLGGRAGALARAYAAEEAAARCYRNALRDGYASPAWAALWRDRAATVDRLEGVDRGRAIVAAPAMGGAIRRDGAYFGRSAARRRQRRTMQELDAIPPRVRAILAADDFRVRLLVLYREAREAGDTTTQNDAAKVIGEWWPALPPASEWDLVVHRARNYATAARLASILADTEAQA